MRGDVFERPDVIQTTNTKYFRGLLTPDRIMSAASEVWRYIFASIEMSVSFFGSMINGLVILTLCKNIYRLPTSTFFILSIAVSDLLSCTVAVPFSIANNLQTTWPFGLAGCKAHAFMIFLLGIVSITHLSAIAAEKYLTISKSFSRDCYFDREKVWRVIVVLWLYSLIFSLGPLVGLSNYGLEGSNATCSLQWNSPLVTDKAYFAVIFFACYFLPVSIITYSYYKIHVLARSIVIKTVQVNGLNQARLRRHRRSAVYLFTVIISFFIAWTPYAVVSFMTLLGIVLDPLVISVPSVFAKTSFLLNSVLYALLSQQFRRWVRLAIQISKRNSDIRPTTRFLQAPPQQRR